MSEQFPEHLFSDPLTGELNRTAKNFAQVQKARKGMEQREQSSPRHKDKTKRGNKPSFALLSVWAAEDALIKDMESTLKQHVLWGGFLENQSALHGMLTARVLGEIRHPHRFPGQKCDYTGPTGDLKGHTVPPMFSVGDICPMEFWDKAPVDEDTGARLPAKLVKCTGLMQEGRARIDPRTGKPETGVRSLFHFAGLIAGDDGRNIGYHSLEEGQTRDWNSSLKTLLMMPKGIAEQIVNHKPEPYYSEHARSYMCSLERMARERKIDLSAQTKGGKTPPEVIRLKGIARKIAAKLWVGDVLMEWKRRSPLKAV